MSTFNKNELIIDRVRSLVAHDLETGKAIFRLTSIEEPSLNCTAESEEVTDAIGSVITTLYRAKRGAISGTNSLMSTDLLAAQYGSKKEVGEKGKEILDYKYEILTIDNGKVTLSDTPVEDIKYIYGLEGNEIATSYVAGTAASATEFVVNGKEITVPTGLTGKVYVEYTYNNENALKVANYASKFPEACSLVMYAYFKDKCNENKVYSGKIVCRKAKLNPEQLELSLTSTGKHPFEFTIMKDYCSDEGDDELYSVIISQ